MYCRLVSTYESASTRRFRHGRVDNIRANSCEALAWIKSMQPDSALSVILNKNLFILILLNFFSRIKKNMNYFEKLCSIRQT